MAEDEWDEQEGYVPSEKRIAKQSIFTIHLVDETRKKLSAAPDTLVKDFITTIANKVGVVGPLVDFFSVADVVDDGSHCGIFVDRYLDPTKRLRDERVNNRSTLVFKVKWMKQWKVEDAFAEEILFAQVQRAIIKEICPCSERLAVKLAALEIQARYGDFDPRKHKIGYLNKVGLNSYLPCTVSRHDYAYWQERLFNVHKKQKGSTRAQVIREYLAVARSIPFYGMVFFEVEDAERKIKYTAGVAEDGVFLFARDNWNLIDSVLFADALAWTKSPDGTAITLHRLEEQRPPLNLSSTIIQIKELTDLLDEYFLLLPPPVRAHLEARQQAECKRRGVNLNSESRAAAFAYRSQMLPDAKLFVPRPAEERVFSDASDDFSSRLEWLKQHYMDVMNPSSAAAIAIMAKDKDAPKQPHHTYNPVRKLSFKMDQNIDDGTTLKEIDVSGESLLDHPACLLLSALASALDYQPNSHTPRPDWKENLSITSLDLSGNNLHTRTLDRLKDHLLPKLTDRFARLNLGGLVLETKGAKALRDVLMTLQFLETLELDDCQLGNKGFLHILEGVEALPKFKTLSVCRNKLSDKAATDLLSKAPALTSLTALSLSGNSFDSKTAESLHQALGMLPKIAHVALSSCYGHASAGGAGGTGLGIVPAPVVSNRLVEGPRIAAITAGWLGSCKTLRFLDMSANKWSCDEVVAITGALSHNKTLTELHLSRNCIGSRLEANLASSLTGFLGVHSGLNHLHLDGNAIPPEFLVALSVVLPSNTALSTLSLRSNSLAGSTGLLSESFLMALRSNKSVNKLDLADNNISGLGILSLLTVLGSGSQCRVTELVLDRNDITIGTDTMKEFTDSLRDALVDLKRLQKLSLDRCRVNDELVKVIGRGIGRSSVVCQLYLARNDITMEGVEALCSSLDPTCGLRTICLSENGLTPSVYSLFETTPVLNIKI